MKVQTKILLLLAVIFTTFIGGLVALKVGQMQRFRAIARERAEERNRIFDEFLAERGDRLRVVVQDSTNWDDLVRAVVKDDRAWAEAHFNDAMLATYQINAIWIYRTDLTLFHSHNNRYAENLRALPLPPEAFKALASQANCHFFVHVPQGWMEIRGRSVHPSRDFFGETKPQGYLFAGHVWIDENIRRMSMFTDYSIKIVPAQEIVAERPSQEERGLITFSRLLPGWDGSPAAQIQVQNDSPIIREFNKAGGRLLLYLVVFAAGVFLVISFCLVRWVRRPLRLISKNLRNENPEALALLQGERTEFGELANLILHFQRTEEALQKTEEELRHAQKLEAVGRLAGGVAHDFNNLLTAIIGYSELVEQRLAEGDEGREFAQMIRKAGEQAAALTRQLLAFSRKQILQPCVLELNSLVLEMEKLLNRVIGEHIRITIHPDAQDARVKADPTQLEQVIINLGLNARDAMPGGGSLTIRTQNVSLDDVAARECRAEIVAGDYVELSVTDTGAGMDEETRGRIFEPFFTTKGPGKGTGLGLATVYGIVRQSGGGISVDSTVGKGTVFRIFLPHDAGIIEESKVEVPLDEPVTSAEIVLVVEDEEVVRQLVCAVLESAGYKVLCAESPSDALRLVQEQHAPIHLLVTDIVMPEMHGPVLAGVLAPLQPGMKVLYISGYSDNDISDQGVMLPGLDMLSKPFTQRVLLNKVREVLTGEPSGDIPRKTVSAEVQMD